MKAIGIVRAIAVTALVSNVATAASQDADWQLDMINSPTVAQLNMEAKGRVFIYDGLHEADIDRAMNGQFHRVERMMFVRTKFAKSPEEGKAPEDDCD